MVDMEDDVFFADLSKRISLFITEEEVEVEVKEEEQQQQKQNYDHVVQGYGKSNDFTRVFPVMIPPTIQKINQPSMVQPGSGPFFYERETRGTGVFIPRSSIPYQKNRSGAGRSKNINKDSAHMLNMNMIPSNKSSSNTHIISSSTCNY
ncbi:hypothetical protein ZOSMA_139G00390 [Zostera marina]|uniref:Uncharacterized protein n=1 Tax=Zostera marina TaxID=29655 RepID=A0A0K9PY62_ZOSMR|nr:hypothetical protein ZOSMA_139G00390 [Zostera marina]